MLKRKSLGVSEVQLSPVLILFSHETLSEHREPTHSTTRELQILIHSLYGALGYIQQVINSPKEAEDSTSPY